MSFKIQNSLDWIAKALGRSLGPESGGEVPAEVDDGIKSTLDVLGWSRYSEMVSNEITAGAGVVNIDTAVTPEGINRLYIFGSMSHTDPIAREARIELADTRGSLTGATIFVVVYIDKHEGPINLADRLALRGPVPVLAGNFLRFRFNTLGGAETMTAAFTFIDLAIGEYLPPL